jgi:hypothetical protein
MASIALLSVWGSAYNLWVIFGRRPIPPLHLERATDFSEPNEPPLSAKGSTLFMIVNAAAWLFGLSYTGPTF